jgi:hypothetical protein
MNLRTLLLLPSMLAAALGLAGCAGAPIVLVDAAYGHEYIVGSRAAHIESMRVEIQAPETGDDGAAVHRFTLRIALDNRHDASWVIARGDLRFEVCPCDGESCPTGMKVGLAFDDPVLLTLAPRSAATLTVPIEIRIAPPDTLYTLEHFPIDLHLRDGEHELLHRRLAVGTFDLIGQGVRLVAVFTGALLLLSVL